ncbi:MAG TPA: alternative ribosome rescue aminoacyl-tRNA hydrolase ArfB [Chitinophagales bacterium]|nr:alternative ribosome rescue aminoacyl-tRNA hydrolase ArfB [Chitinophagales bacterium]
MKVSARNFLPELQFKTSRSSGAGGQHVNKTETKVELLFDVQASALLSAKEKETILQKLESRINAEGILQVSCATGRSQAGNKEGAVKKFYALLEKALKPVKKRVPTTVPTEVKEKIKRHKKQRSEIKASRNKRTRDFL